jgi:hypothetical protein
MYCTFFFRGVPGVVPRWGGEGRDVRVKNSTAKEQKKNAKCRSLSC